MEMCGLNAVHGGSIRPPKNMLSTMNFVKQFFLKDGRSDIILIPDKILNSDYLEQIHSPLSAMIAVSWYKTH